MQFDWLIQYDVIRSMGTIMQKLMTSHFAIMLQLHPDVVFFLPLFLSKTKSAKNRSAQIYDKATAFVADLQVLKQNERVEMKDATRASTQVMWGRSINKSPLEYFRIFIKCLSGFYDFLYPINLELLEASLCLGESL